MKKLCEAGAPQWQCEFWANHPTAFVVALIVLISILIGIVMWVKK